ncbi:MAG: hypothetical protein MI975_12905, partial [Cytophagales bacterium]|nr:hypothetical protein [Cytophagales bacterium]
NINMLHAIFGDHEINVEKEGEDHMAWVDFVIYNGDEKDFDLTQLGEACFAWQTYIGKDVGNTTEAQIVVGEENLLKIATDDMSISVPAKPSLENNLQDAFNIKVNP